MLTHVCETVRRQAADWGPAETLYPDRHALRHQASAAARDLEKPPGLIDGIMLAYKASKTAVTQSARPLAAARVSVVNETPAVPQTLQTHLLLRCHHV